jgi:hypothetical protein
MTEHIYHSSNAEPASLLKIIARSIILLEPQDHDDKSLSALWQLYEDDSCNAATLIGTSQFKRDKPGRSELPAAHPAKSLQCNLSHRDQRAKPVAGRLWLLPKMRRTKSHDSLHPRVTRVRCRISLALRHDVQLAYLTLHSSAFEF